MATHVYGERKITCITLILRIAIKYFQMASFVKTITVYIHVHVLDGDQVGFLLPIVSFLTGKTAVEHSNN